MSEKVLLVVGCGKEATSHEFNSMEELQENLLDIFRNSNGVTSLFLSTSDEDGNEGISVMVSRERG